jgi:hypothetical protein
VKHPNRITVKDIVKDFKRVGVPVKPDKQPLIFGVFIVFKITVISGGVNRPSNVGLADTVFEGGFGESDVNVHVFSILLAAVRVKPLRRNSSSLGDDGLKQWAPGVVAGFAVVEADAEVGGLAGGTHGEVDDVRLAVGVYHVGEFQRIGRD